MSDGEWFCDQPVVLADGGIIRLQNNPIVRHLYGSSGFTTNLYAGTFAHLEANCLFT